MTATTLSRAAQVASVHLGPINASRKRAGLAPLSAGEVEREFADVDRSPLRTKGVAARRTFSNAGAADSMWSGIVAKLNATLPTRAQPDLNSTPSPRPASRAPQSQAEADAMWAGIARRGNAEAGLRMPTGRRA